MGQGQNRTNVGSSLLPIGTVKAARQAVAHNVLTGLLPRDEAAGVVRALGLDVDLRGRPDSDMVSLGQCTLADNDLRRVRPVGGRR